MKVDGSVIAHILTIFASRGFCLFLDPVASVQNSCSISTVILVVAIKLLIKERLWKLSISIVVYINIIDHGMLSNIVVRIRVHDLLHVRGLKIIEEMCSINSSGCTDQRISYLFTHFRKGEVVVSISIDIQ